MERRFIQGLKKLTDKTDVSWKGSLFVTIAYRWSNEQDHSYPVGAYRTLDSAINNANKEVQKRGGKYGCKVYATQHVNKFKEDRLVEIYEIESPYKGKAGKKLSMAFSKKINDIEL
jgi:hypothetical protein